MGIAARTGAEIVSVDSMQVYRGMDIGTAKPSEEDRDRVPHHLVDIAHPSDDFSVAEFQAVGRNVLEALAERDVPALIVGGSGLHFRSLVDPLEFPPTDVTVKAALEAMSARSIVAELLAADPAAGEVVDLANPRRVIRAVEVFRITGRTPSQRSASKEAGAVRSYESRIPVVAAGFDPGDLLTPRVVGRFDAMLAAGLLAEVAGLAETMGRTARAAVGYRQLLPVVTGERSQEDGRRRAVDATTSLARRQRTFFRRDPRISWPGWDDDSDVRAGRALRVFEEAGWTS